MNKVFLIGRLTKDPDIRYTGSNIAVASFTLAVDRSFTNQNGEVDADFIKITVWRKQAENVGKYLKKGSQIAVDGRIQTGSYDDPNGQKVYTTEVVANNVQFLDTKSSREGNNGSFNNDSNTDVNPYDFTNNVETTTSNVNSDPFKDFGEEIKIEDDDLPF